MQNNLRWILLTLGNETVLKCVLPDQNKILADDRILQVFDGFFQRVG